MQLDIKYDHHWETNNTLGAFLTIDGKVVAQINDDAEDEERVQTLIKFVNEG